MSSNTGSSQLAIDAPSQAGTGGTTSLGPVTEDEETLLSEFSQKFAQKVVGRPKGPLFRDVSIALTSGFLKEHEKRGIFTGLLHSAAHGQSSQVTTFAALPGWIQKAKDDCMDESDYTDDQKAFINERWQTVKDGVETAREEMFPSQHSSEELNEDQPHA